jgi:hypothetical protein
MFLRQYTSLRLCINFIMTKRHDTAGRARLYLGTRGLLGLWPTDDPLIDVWLWPLRGGSHFHFLFSRKREYGA